MVQALVTLDENTNRVLSVVKAKYGFKDKGEAIEFVVTRYIEEENEPELRPEFIKYMKKVQKEKSIRIKDWDKHFGLKKDVSSRD